MQNSNDSNLETFRNKLFDFIAEISLGAFRVEELSGETRIIIDLEFDSLDYATLMLMGENFLATKVKESEINWTKIETIDELAILLLNSRE
jgi:acyl carrier protein